MKTFVTIPVLMIAVAAGIAFADVGLKNAGATIGPVRDIDAALDGGIIASRGSPTSTGLLRCASASAVDRGCVDTGTQTFAGAKTFSSTVRVGNYTHAALPAGCSAGQLAYCTTHDSISECKGIGGGVFTFVDEFGSSGGTVTLATLSGNKMLHALTGYLGILKLPYAYTITRITGIVRSGVGASAVVKVRFTDGANLCDCSIHCDTATIDDCTGNCTYAANTSVAATPTSDACTGPPTLLSDLVVTGYK